METALLKKHLAHGVKDQDMYRPMTKPVCMNPVTPRLADNPVLIVHDR
jgi:hypothetical protein